MHWDKMDWKQWASIAVMGIIIPLGTYLLS